MSVAKWAEARPCLQVFVYESSLYLQSHRQFCNCKRGRERAGRGKQDTLSGYERPVRRGLTIKWREALD